MTETHGAIAAEAGQAGHHEHLEVWPDAGITETAYPVHWWLVVLYFCFAAGLSTAYYHQFVGHTLGYPKFGPGYFYKSEEQQYPGKVEPVITTAGEFNWTVGQEVKNVFLTAEGGRVGRNWHIGEGSLPPGVEISGTEAGTALAGTPTKAGEFHFKLVCTSGGVSAEKSITINVTGPQAK
jgi:hypothetical protein